jgi:hypothetical protein
VQPKADGACMSHYRRVQTVSVAAKYPRSGRSGSSSSFVLQRRAGVMSRPSNSW